MRIVLSVSSYLPFEADLRSFVLFFLPGVGAFLVLRLCRLEVQGQKFFGEVRDHGVQVWNVAGAFSPPLAEQMWF